jgi:acyl carrier protein
LNLEDMTAEQIDAEQALFVDGLGLDSIDALELGLALQQRYGVSMTADAEQTRQHFASIRALAQFVAQQRSK